MKALIKIFILMISVICILVGNNNINHSYEIAEKRYDEYVEELPVDEDYDEIQISPIAEKYYVSSNIKEIISVNICILVFGMLLLLILIVDFIKWVNTWEKDEDV